MAYLDIDGGTKVPAAPRDGLSDVAIAQVIQTVAAPVNQVEHEMRFGAFHCYLQAALAGLRIGAGGEVGGEGNEQHDGDS